MQRRKKRVNRLRLFQLLLLLVICGAFWLGIDHYRQRQQITITAPALIVRSAPNSSREVTTITKNTTVTRLKQRKGWVKIFYRGKIGWLPTWLIHSQYDATKATNRLAEQTIVIDAGHGGSDSGALATNGTYEKYYTLKMAQALATKLKTSAARVIMTRSHDQSVALSQRPALANQVGASLFISFHFDSTPEADTASGFTAYYYHAASKKFAQTLSQQLNALALTNRGTAYGNFQVIRDSTMPAVLLEMGYINDTTDYQSISSASYQQQVAQLIYQGLQKYTATN